MADRADGSRLPTKTVQAAARREVRRAVETMINEAGGRTVARLRSTQHDWPGTITITPEPIAGIESAHAIEQAAHALIKDLIRQAREAGRSWHEIGEGLDLHWQAVLAKESIADIAYGYALSYQPETGMRTFTWTCPACLQLITDQSPFRKFLDQEEGHADGCPRWAADLAEWHRLQRE